MPTQATGKTRKKTTARRKQQPAAAPPGLRDRVVELRRVRASELRKNEKNWRLHPDEQRGALQAMFKDVGFVGAVIARELPDKSLQMLDGHLRADVAGDEEVPVIIVDLDDTEAAKVLATYDPMSQMAVTDADALSDLLNDFEFDAAFDEDAYLRKMLTDIHAKLAKEEKVQHDLKESEREIPNMALRPHEHYDYLVVLATTTQEWNILCSRLKLIPTKRRKRMGTCRAIHAAKLLELLPSDD